MGFPSHSVGDGSKLLHTSIHYNGWATIQTRKASPTCARLAARSRADSSVATSVRTWSSGDGVITALSKGRRRVLERLAKEKAGKGDQ
jgi:hypothetical protein